MFFMLVNWSHLGLNRGLYCYSPYVLSNWIMRPSCWMVARNASRNFKFVVPCPSVGPGFDFECPKCTPPSYDFFVTLILLLPIWVCAVCLPPGFNTKGGWQTTRAKNSCLRMVLHDLGWVFAAVSFVVIAGCRTNGADLYEVLVTYLILSGYSC